MHAYLGSELRNWLLYYSIPVVHGVLPQPYVDHFAHLVAGILLLSSEKITQSDVQRAKSHLGSFYGDFSSLYGKILIILLYANGPLLL